MEFSIRLLLVVVLGLAVIAGLMAMSVDIGSSGKDTVNDQDKKYRDGFDCVSKNPDSAMEECLNQSDSSTEFRRGGTINV